MEESRSTWILSGPVCLSMLANAFFLVNIVRVLVTKLKAPSQSSYGSSHQRATSYPHRAEMMIDENYRPEENGGGVNGRVPSPGTGSAGATAATNQHRAGPSLNGLRKAVRYDIDWA